MTRIDPGVQAHRRTSADASPSSDDAVVFSAVTKTFDTGTRALRETELRVAHGEFLLLLGPSGCGKSTIIRLISGLTEPTSGRITVLGDEPTAARDGQQLAYVFQEATLLPWAKVEKNVALPLELRGADTGTIAAEVDRVLRLVGLGDYRDHLPHQLSGGMKMRVSIARALITRPRLLLMDEPFAALDEITRQGLQDELLALTRAQRHTTVIFVTHNVFEAAYLASRVIVLTGSPGSIAADIAVGRGGIENDRRSDAGFIELVERIQTALRQGSSAGRAEVPR